jgi:hypothetical protein
VGAPEDYAATDPEGACVSTSERVLPRVVLSTGKVWDCTAGLWVARTPSGLPITDDGSTLTVVGRGLDVGAYPIRASSISTGSGPLRISSHTGTCPTTAETDPVTMLQYDFTLCVEGTTLYTVSSLGVKTSMSGGGGSPYTPLVSGDWTTVNGSHCTPTFDTGALTIVSEVGSGDEICGKSIAIPTAPFARTFWVVPLLNGGNYPGASVGFSDGTQYFDCGVGAVSLALGLGAARWTNDHTYSGASYTPPTIIPANGTLMAFRLTVGQNLDGGTDAGKMHCGWSVSGTDGSWIELWNDVVGTTVSGSAMTPTKLYVATNPSSSGTVQRLQVVSYK